MNSSRVKYSRNSSVVIFASLIGKLLFCLSILLFWGAGDTASADQFPLLIIESGDSKPMQVIEGPAELLDQRFCAASTFKIWLAALALEKKLITSATRFQCQEPHLYGGRKAVIGLREALVLSSNAFFLETARLLGLKRINKGVSELHLRNCNESGSVVRKLSDAIHGDKFRISPREQHQAMRSLVEGSSPVSRNTWQSLREAIRWPVPDDSHWQVFGKTGCYGGVVWFTGFGEMRPLPPPPGAIYSQPRPERKVVTVFVQGDLSRRPEVIRRFFSRFGLKWQDSWLSELAPFANRKENTPSSTSSAPGSAVQSSQ